MFLSYPSLREVRDEAIWLSDANRIHRPDCFAALAMTDFLI